MTERRGFEPQPLPEQPETTPTEATNVALNHKERRRLYLNTAISGLWWGSLPFLPSIVTEQMVNDYSNGDTKSAVIKLLAHSTFNFLGVYNTARAAGRMFQAKR